MKRKVICIVCLLLLGAVLTSCAVREEENPTGDISDSVESLSCAESQWGLERSTANGMTELNGIIYFIDNDFLYYIDESGTARVLCSDPDCEHDKGDPRACGAYHFMSSRIFSQDGCLYVTSLDEDGSGNQSIKKYTPEGGLVETVYTVPAQLQHMICYQGVLYFTYYIFPEDLDTSDPDWMFPSPIIGSFNLETGEEKTIYTSDYESGYMGNLFAAGDYLYFLESGYEKDSNGLSNMVGTGYKILNISNGSISNLEVPDNLTVGNIFVYDNQLLMNLFSGEAQKDKTCYTANLDGSNCKKYKELAYPCGISAVYDDVMITANTGYDGDSYPEVEAQSPENKIYKAGKEILTFDFSDLAGKDYSNELYYDTYVSDSMIMYRFRDGTIIGLDKADVVNGTFVPFVVYDRG